MDNNNLVSKSNDLIKSRYNLNLQEQKLILTLASLVQPNDEEFKPYEFTVKEFMNLLNIKDKNTYKNLDKVIKGLMEKTFVIKKETGEYIRIAWLSSAKYFNGKVALEFSANLKPYLLKLKRDYTSYKLENVLNLKSAYSIRLFEILKSNIFKCNIIIDIGELKYLLQADEKTYSSYGLFKQKILLKAQKELKEKTDIEFEFEEIKTGRKVTALKFFIKENEKNKSKNSFKEIENKIDEIKAKKEKNIVQNEEEKEIKIDEFEDKNIKYLYELFEEKISKKNIKKIIKKAENDIEKIKKIYEYSKTQDIDNLVGFMLKMVEGNNFIEPVEGRKFKKETDLRFNDFPQREYDYDKLENKLLGWDKDLKIEEEENQEEFEDEDINIVQKMKRELEEEKKKEEETKYVSEIDTVKIFLEEQLTGIFGEVKYKSWLKYGVDNLDIDDKNIVHFDFKNEFALKIFEKDYKDVVVELISSVEPLLQLQTNIR